MIEGFYAIYYTGVAGSGFGMLVIKDGTIVGADVSGGAYDGTLRHDPGQSAYVGDLKLKVPANTPLVTGAPPQPNAYEVPIAVTIPEDSVGEQTPATVRLPTGPVNVILRRLRDA